MASHRKKRSPWIVTGVLALLTLLGIIYLLLLPIIFPVENVVLHTNEDAVTFIPSSSPSPSSAPLPTPEPTPEPPAFTEAKWIGVGDIMSHTPQLPGAYDKATDTYNFNPYFEPIYPLLEDGDWVMANLETPIAGKEFGYTGYPTFNAPIELAEALKNAGFYILSTANNHSLDKGEKGLLKTLDHVQELGFTTVGTARSQEEADQAVMVTQNDITMGFLSYTYGTNGIPIPSGKDYLVNLIDQKQMKEDIQTIRTEGAEVVTIALHFGNEYQTKPTEEQKNLARSLIAAGADIIAGSHPHVLQPYEIVSVTEQDGTTREGVIIYSMGNFISNQRGDTKDYGAVFSVQLRKHYTDNSIEIVDVAATPTWVHRYKPDQHYRYRVLPIENVLGEENDSLLNNQDYSNLKRDLVSLNERLQSMQAEVFKIELADDANNTQAQ